MLIILQEQLQASLLQAPFPGARWGWMEQAVVPWLHSVGLQHCPVLVLQAEPSFAPSLHALSWLSSGSCEWGKSKVCW